MDVIGKTSKTYTSAPRVEDKILELKKFKPANRSFWAHVPDQLWEDWHWQLRNQIQTQAQLRKLGLQLNPEEIEGIAFTTHRLKFGFTPYFACLIDWDNPTCPLRRQVVPLKQELKISPGETLDPCGEDKTTPVPGLIHRYPDRVLLIANTICAGYCRFCTRSRLVSHNTYIWNRQIFNEQIKYLQTKREIRDVLISGGDPLLLCDEKLAFILESVRAIPHIEIIRIGTRAPIFLPQRVTDELIKTLRKFHPIYISVHVNHPTELTVEAHAALEKLADAGFPLGSQTVLLRGINDDPTVLIALFQKLLICRVKPYYLYQCDPIAGAGHFRVPVQKGLQILKSIQGFTTGYALPHYVIDAPRGGGKIPLSPNYIVRITQTEVILRNYRGQICEYPAN